MNNERNKLVPQSPNQYDPARARPDDFQPVKEELPFSGKCSDSEAEYEQLLRESTNQEGKRKPAPLPKRNERRLKEGKAARPKPGILTTR